MEDYKLRFIKEYEELDERTNKLVDMLDKWDFAVIGTDKNNPDELTDEQKKKALGFVPKCSYDLLNKQLLIMIDYRAILLERAEIENIEFPKHESK